MVEVDGVSSSESGGIDICFDIMHGMGITFNCGILNNGRSHPESYSSRFRFFDGDRLVGDDDLLFFFFLLFL